MKIKFDDIEMAYIYVNSDQQLMNTAVISKTTGKIYYQSEMFDSDEMPEDIEDDDYISIPHKNDLDLGQKLVWLFVEQNIPEFTEKVRSIFSNRGAYSRYKSFLENINLLEKWHKFEEKRTQDALKLWCKEEGIDVGC